jgi:capsular exopolysaccharide synthesis family protein
MEKIKDALAKAKVEEVAKPNRAEKNSQKKKAVAESGDVKRTSNPAKVSEDIGHIQYAPNSIIKLDAKHLEANRVVSNLSHNANASIFNSLRTQVLHKMEENNWQTIAIVSPTPESGKTFVSINLAMAIARQPQKTALLVDFDLHKPKVADYLGINVQKSMNEYFQEEAEIEDILVNPAIQGFTVLPTMQAIERSTEILSSNRVKNLINKLKNRYESRIVVFDLPPLLNVDDAMVLLPHLDCILLVIANGVSTQPEIEETMHLLPSEKLLGVVYNKAEEEKKTYYY